MSLKIPKWQSESVNRRRTDNTMVKRKKTKGQTTIYRFWELYFYYIPLVKQCYLVSIILDFWSTENDNAVTIRVVFIQSILYNLWNFVFHFPIEVYIKTMVAILDSDIQKKWKLCKGSPNDQSCRVSVQFSFYFWRQKYIFILPIENT
jgi:hypothetical protein